MSESGATAEAGTSRRDYPNELSAELAGFQAWLATAPDSPPQLDFLELLRHFTALRHEVNLQTKASRTANEQFAEALRIFANPPKPTDPREPVRPLVRALMEATDALRTAYHQLTRTDDHLFALTDQLAELAESALPDPPSVRVSAPPSFFARLLGRPGTDDTPWASWAEQVQSWQEDQREQLEAVYDRLESVIRSIADGYALSLRRLERALADQGLEAFDGIGTPFDPALMEAIELVDGEPSGHVVECVRPGYTWNGELFRTAQVKVAR